MKSRLVLWLIITILLVVVVLAVRTHKLTAGVWTTELVAGCALDYHTSAKAVALACPGVDYIMLWPLPVVQPWEEPGDSPTPLYRLSPMRAEHLHVGT